MKPHNFRFTREARSVKYAIYRKTRLSELRANSNEYDKRRRATDPAYRMQKSIRGRISKLLRYKRVRKSAKTSKLIGCTWPELKLYLEKQFQPGMGWHNYGKWHVDHIQSCNTFNLVDVAEQQKCFHYTNLRPLWAKDNLSRPKDNSDLRG